MKVQIMIEENLDSPYLVIHTPQVTDEIKHLMNYIENEKALFTVNDLDRYVILKPEDVYFVQSIEGNLQVHTKLHTYTSSKKLYEIPVILGKSFVRVSKNGYINMTYLESVESTWSGMMKFTLKNGKSDYISRMYVKPMKQYLGI